MCVCLYILDNCNIAALEKALLVDLDLVAVNPG